MMNFRQLNYQILFLTGIFTPQIDQLIATSVLNKINKIHTQQTLVKNGDL